MKAIRMTAFHELSVVDERMPEITDGEALIHVTYAGICASDVHVLEGKHPSAKPPLILGHEFCGELVDIQVSGRTEFKIGDTVTAHPLSSCGRCEQCGNGRHNLCADLSIFGVHQDGCFAEYRKVPAETLVKVRPSVDPTTAALVEPFAVAVHDVRRSGLRLGDTVCVIGAGTIGILLAMAAEMAGAGPIALCEIDEKRKTFAREMGFPVFDPKEPDFERRVLDYSGGRGYDRVFEVSGAQGGCDLMTRFAKTGATVIPVGIPSRPLSVDVVAVILKELDVKGVRIHTFNNFKASADIINGGTIASRLHKVISKIYDPGDVRRAFADLESDKSIVKALIRFH